MTTGACRPGTVHEGCWFCCTPMCEHCPDLPTPVWEDLRDAAVLVCPTCAGLTPVREPVTGAGACGECQAPAGQPCFDHCPSGMQQDLDNLEAAEVELAHEATWWRHLHGGAA